MDILNFKTYFNHFLWIRLVSLFIGISNVKAILAVDEQQCYYLIYVEIRRFFRLFISLFVVVLIVLW